MDNKTNGSVNNNTQNIASTTYTNPLPETKKKKTITAIESIKKHLDIDGLSHLVTLFTNFVTSYAATKNHNHDSSYAKASHTHTTAQVANLDTALAGKAATSHTHTIAQVTNLQSQLDSKQAKGSYAAASHSHAWSAITGKPSSFTPASHNHSAANITSGTLAVARGGTGVTTNNAIGLKAYPVGAVYISYSSTSPASLFGGSWTAITGRFPYFNAGTGTGGSNSHTLSVNELASHYHDIKTYVYRSGSRYGWHANNAGNTTDYNKVDVTTAVGGNKAHNNMPAYQTFYAWRRIK